jgi:hypothetical protein
MKAIHSAATLYASDDAKGRLPQGGYHKIESDGTVKDIDDGIGMMIHDFFKLSRYIISYKNLPTDYSTIMALPKPEKARLVTICIQDGCGKVFTCPEMRNAGESVVDFITRKPSSTGNVYFKSDDYARIGYCYLAGFETEKWNFDKKGDITNNPNVQAWVSPMTTGSRGDCVLITDRARYVPTGESWINTDFLEYQHGAQGWKRIQGLKSGFDYTTIKGGTCVGTLDGAIKFKTFKNSKLRQMYYDTGNGGIDHRDFTFF